MEIRYEEAPEHAFDIMKKLIYDYFPDLMQAKILILMDLKRRGTDEKITLGRISKTNDLIRHLTIDESNSEDGYDYIIYLDKVMWNNTEDADRIRVIRHELRHTKIDLEAKNPYKLRPHSIEDFYSEVELNTDDPRWRERVGSKIELKYLESKNPAPPSQQQLPGMEGIEIIHGEFSKEK